MIGRIIVTAQVEVKFYETEANIVIDALKSFESPSQAVNDVITGTIKELNEINNIEAVGE